MKSSAIRRRSCSRPTALLADRVPSIPNATANPMGPQRGSDPGIPATPNRRARKRAPIQVIASGAKRHPGTADVATRRATVSWWRLLRTSVWRLVLSTESEALRNSSNLRSRAATVSWSRATTAPIAEATDAITAPRTVSSCGSTLGVSPWALLARTRHAEAPHGQRRS